jgi:3-hydroxyisobutyrate dehydrogenase-like beta-hydroxyacid dehydrogenase
VYESIVKDKNLPTLQSERLFIDTSTIDPTTSIEVAESIRSSGSGSFIDAPMSGGVVGATAGTLTFMLGAPTALIARATEALAPMSKKVIPMGLPGSGLKAKLANNYLLALNNIATCEAMHMGIEWGLDPKALASLINISTGKCWPSEVNNPVPGVIPTSPSSRDYDGGFGVSLMNKDLKLALKACEDANVKTILGEKAKDVYNQLEQDPKLKTKDFSVVYRWLGGKE